MKEQIFLNGNKSKEPTIQIQKKTAPLQKSLMTHIFLNSAAILPVILSCALHTS